jgi:hypothetical protein
MRLHFQGLRAVRFKVIGAVLLVAHALVHPVLHAVPVSPSEQVQLRAELPAEQRSPAEVKPPCLGCLLQRRFDAPPPRIVLPASLPVWEYVVAGSERALAAVARSAPSTRAPPSF